MIDYAETEYDKAIALREAEEAKLDRELKQVTKLANMSFHKRIQEEGQEEVLKRVESGQLEAMKAAIKRDYRELRGQEEELHAEFMTEYLRGICPNIVEFLGERFGYKGKFKSYPKTVLGKESNFMKCLLFMLI